MTRIITVEDSTFKKIDTFHKTFRNTLEVTDLIEECSTLVGKVAGHGKKLTDVRAKLSILLGQSSVIGPDSWFDELSDKMKLVGHGELENELECSGERRW